MHIVKVGLSLLAHASMPLRFLDDAFQTTIFLINRLPSRVINQSTPIYNLFGSKPDYTFLKTLGVLTGLTFALIMLINYNSALYNVSSLAIVAYTKDTNVSIDPLGEFIFPMMSFLIKKK